MKPPSRRQRLQRVLDQIKLARGCALRQAAMYSCQLDLHHVDPAQKDFMLSKLYKYSPERIAQELKKCVILRKDVLDGLNRDILQQTRTRLKVAEAEPERLRKELANLESRALSAEDALKKLQDFMHHGDTWMVSRKEYEDRLMRALSAEANEKRLWERLRKFEETYSLDVAAAAKARQRVAALEALCRRAGEEDEDQDRLTYDTSAQLRAAGRGEEIK